MPSYPGMKTLVYELTIQFIHQNEWYIQYYVLLDVVLEDLFSIFTYEPILIEGRIQVQNDLWEQE